MKKKDLILIVAMMLIAGGLLAAVTLSTAGTASSGQVRIYVNDQLYAQESLGKERDIAITQPDGQENILHLTADGFYMLRANCVSQDCIHQGPVTAENYYQRALLNKVVCAHNNVYVELVLTNQTPPPDMPDI